MRQATEKPRKRAPDEAGGFAGRAAQPADLGSFAPGAASSALALGGRGSRPVAATAPRHAGSGPLQAKLRVGAVDDPLECEADRVADAVVSGSAAPSVQRKCAACEEEEKLQTKRSAGSAPEVSSKTASRIDSFRGGGETLSPAARSYFEPRFGRDLSAVRLHTGGEAATAAREVGARAFTVGSDIAFGAGEYRPETPAGSKLLAHELTHTVQQGVVPLRLDSGPAVQERLDAETIAGDWIIDNPTRKFPAGGPEDATLLEGAFSQICSLAFRSGNRIQLGLGPPNPSQLEGCGCLQDIENDLASSTPVLSGTPHAALEPHGWSFTQASAPLVSARHPASDFSWGYWTGGQTRHLKPFWQTVAHEACGHLAAHVRSKGTSAGARGVGTGHNVAIEGENRIATEHGVPAGELRGLDIDPATGKPLAGHRGESFLQASVFDFAHGSAALPAIAATVVSEAADTIQTVSASSSLDLMVQVEGRAFASEGGLTLAASRAEAVRLAIEAELRLRSVPLTVTTGATSRSRFFPDLTAFSPGTSTPLSSNPGRRADVFLFHQPHSAGP
jgi:uncharacterized protein DUF4157